MIKHIFNSCNLITIISFCVSPLFIACEKQTPIDDFTTITYNLTLISSDTLLGIVKKSGTYDAKTKVTIKAIAKEFCEFVQWSDTNDINMERKVRFYYYSHFQKVKNN